MNFSPLTLLNLNDYILFSTSVQFQELNFNLKSLFGTLIRILI